LVAPPAAAQFSSVSGDLRAGSGGWSRSLIPPITETWNFTTWSQRPYPDDRNSATVDASGALHVKFDISGGASHYAGRTIEDASWKLSFVRVVFQLDRPAIFTLKSSGVSSDMYLYPQLILSGPLGTLVSIAGLVEWAKPSNHDISGVLQPGGYALTGFAVVDRYVAWPGPPGYSEWISLSGELVVVAPEPSSIGVLFVGAVLLLRPRRTRAPTSTASGSSCRSS
jgi:hypothetical protein